MWGVLGLKSGSVGATNGTFVPCFVIYCMACVLVVLKVVDEVVFDSLFDAALVDGVPVVLLLSAVIPLVLVLVVVLFETLFDEVVFVTTLLLTVLRDGVGDVEELPQPTRPNMDKSATILVAVIGLYPAIKSPQVMSCDAILVTRLR
jgi:hypothetical protein